PSMHRFTLLSAASALFAAAVPAQVQFLGVAAGDATENSAILWTRAVDATAPATLNLAVDVSTDPAFVSNVSTTLTATDPAKDYPAKTEIPGLQPATRYYYRFRNLSLISGVGTFKTAPAANAAASVRFGFSGDCDGLMRPYPLVSVFPSLNLDYFVYLGDT